MCRYKTNGHRPGHAATTHYQRYHSRTTTDHSWRRQTTEATNGSPFTKHPQSGPFGFGVDCRRHERATDGPPLSLSGVVVRNERGVWRLVEGSNFHDPLPIDCSDHTENFVLPGGIRAIFNHSRTPKRWHVLPPPTPSPSGGSRSDLDHTEHAQTVMVEDMDIGYVSCVIHLTTGDFHG